MTRLATLLKINAISLPKKIKFYKSLVLSIIRYCMDVRAGRWPLIWRGESRPLKTNTVKNVCHIIGAYWTASTKHSEYSCVWQRVDILAGRQQLLLPTVKLSGFGHVMIHCRRSYYKEQWMIGLVVAYEDLVNHWRTTSVNGQASWCRHCCASRMTEVDGQWSQQMHMLGFPNDAWASRVLVIFRPSAYVHPAVRPTRYDDKYRSWNYIALWNSIN